MRADEPLSPSVVPIAQVEPVTYPRPLRNVSAQVKVLQKRLTEERTLIDESTAVAHSRDHSGSNELDRRAYLMRYSK